MQQQTSFRAGEYFIAVAGLAMIRNIITNPPAAQQRMADVRHVLERWDEFPQNLDFPVIEYEVEDGYTRWAPKYDGPNPAIEREEPFVREMLAGAKPGRALDAACGTGRHAAMLAALGYNVIGVDTTDAMMAVAREKVPGADFRRGRLEALPVDDASVDLVMCTLALTHVDKLEPVIAEFARVLSPGGRVILSDMHPVVTLLAGVGGAAGFPMEDGSRGIPFVRNRTHHPSAYISAALGAGLRVAGCIEPPITEEMMRYFPTHVAYPEATKAAFVGLPYLLIWDLRREE